MRCIQAGIFDSCKSAERKHGHEDAIDWKQREEEFKIILNETRNKAKRKYDCLVPVSGGKDSTWQVYAMKKIHGMNPLAVTFYQFYQFIKHQQVYIILKYLEQ